jgi:N-acetylglucosamine kinase-like BadF-type ATPase
MHVIGIDAGGTKTVCVLANERGEVVAEARGAGANLQAVGELQVEKVIHGVMREAIGDRPVRPEMICLGIAGADRPEDAATVNGIMTRIGLNIPALVVNDALVALTAGVGHAPGVVVVAGTGSIAYGRNEANKAARAGGWGYLFGDEGAGFWIGRAVLVAVVKQYDGRGPATGLTDLVLAHLGLTSPQELVHEIYGDDVHRGRISGLAHLLVPAVAAQDTIAIGILEHAAAELAMAAQSVVGRLGLRDRDFATVLSGGMFRGIPALVESLGNRIRGFAPRSDVRLLGVEPAMGAVRLALEAANGRLELATYL